MKKLFFILLIALVLAPNVSLAEITCGALGSVGYKIDNGGKVDLMLSKVCGALSVLGIFAVVIGFIISGFMYVLAQGDPGKFKTANQFLLYTIIGGIVIFLPLVFLKFVKFIAG